MLVHGVDGTDGTAWVLGVPPLATGPPLVYCTLVQCVQGSGPVAGSQRSIQRSCHIPAGDTDNALPPHQAASLDTSIKHTFTDWFTISFMRFMW